MHDNTRLQLETNVALRCQIHTMLWWHGQDKKKNPPALIINATLVGDNDPEYYKADESDGKVGFFLHADCVSQIEKLGIAQQDLQNAGKWGPKWTVNGSPEVLIKQKKDGKRYVHTVALVNGVPPLPSRSSGDELARQSAGPRDRVIPKEADPFTTPTDQKTGPRELMFAASNHLEKAAKLIRRALDRE